MASSKEVNFYEFLTSKCISKASPPLKPQSYQNQGHSRLLSAQEVMMVSQNWFIYTFGMIKTINEQKAIECLMEVSDQFHFVKVKTQINQEHQWLQFEEDSSVDLIKVETVEDIQQVMNSQQKTGFRLLKFKKPQGEIYNYAIMITANRAVLDINSAKAIFTEFNWAYAGQGYCVEKIGLPATMLTSQSGINMLNSLTISQAKQIQDAIFPIGAQIGSDPGTYYEGVQRLLFEVDAKDFPSVDEDFKEKFTQSSLIHGCNVMLAVALAYFYEDLEMNSQFKFDTLYELDSKSDGNLGSKTLYFQIVAKGGIRTTLWEIVTDISNQAFSRSLDTQQEQEHTLVDRDLAVVCPDEPVSLASFNDYQLIINEAHDPVDRMSFFTIQNQQNFDLLDIFQVCKIQDHKFIVLQNIKKQFATMEQNMKIRELWCFIINFVKQHQKTMGNVNVNDFVQIITKFNAANKGILK